MQLNAFVAVIAFCLTGAEAAVQACKCIKNGANLADASQACCNQAKARDGAWLPKTQDCLREWICPTMFDDCCRTFGAESDCPALRRTGSL